MVNPTGPMPYVNGFSIEFNNTVNQPPGQQTGMNILVSVANVVLGDVIEDETSENDFAPIIYPDNSNNPSGPR